MPVFSTLLNCGYTLTTLEVTVLNQPHECTQYSIIITFSEVCIAKKLLFLLYIYELPSGIKFIHLKLN